jgi:copper oxidase (laccase) domain-containing protein
LNNDRKNEDKVSSSFGITGGVPKFESNLEKQITDINMSILPKLNIDSLSILQTTIKALQNNMESQLKDINMSILPKISTDSLSILQTTIKAFQNNMQSQLKDINMSILPKISTDSLSILQTTIKALQNNMQSQLKDINISILPKLNTDSFSILETTVKAFQNNMQSQLKDINMSILPKLNTDSLNILKTTIKAVQSNMQSQLKDIDFSNIRISENGTIDYLDETININETIDEISLCINSEVSWEQNIVAFLEKLKSKRPIIIFVVIMFIIQPFYQYYLDFAKGQISTTIEKIKDKPEIKNDRNKIIKDIKTDVIKEVYFNQGQDDNLKMALKEYRFINVESLNVRISNSTKSTITFTLKFGQVVRVLEKSKDWILIEYTDNESLYIKGWVFSKYTSTFN